MIRFTPYGTFVSHYGVTRAALGFPVICMCGHEAFMVINREGRTRCVECDEKYLVEVSDGHRRNALVGVAG